jgi:hypothetical protein
MDREEDAKVYNILSAQKYKTDYVIKAVLNYVEKTDKEFDMKIIKQAVKEAICECGGITQVNGIKGNDDFIQPELPDTIFDMFDKL